MTSPEVRKLPGRNRRIEGSSLMRHTKEERRCHKLGKVDQRSSKKGARVNTANLRAGSIITEFSEKFGFQQCQFETPSAPEGQRGSNQAK
ncbi:hypothetical protein DSO57_1019443 [Entomophthora muscae]|uniref:Uncharacterized protein n=1 Tax=Entomophthora muscae TaxID=34485 RepID=A0ACC2RVC9_9FUNG|nr:hypothetical protein DSO57_1019443 [Entomophthora muscae]